MQNLPTDPRKIKERIRRYERDLIKDKKEFGMVRDGAGKRYLLGPLYLMLGDIEKTLEHYAWFQNEFPDDIGDTLQLLCWALTLYRKGDTNAASKKLIQAMLENLYLIPHFMGIKQERPDVEDGSAYVAFLYLDYLPLEVFELCTQKELDWISRQYHSDKFTAIRDKYTDICRLLKTEPRGSKRNKLVKQMFKLKRLDFGNLNSCDYNKE